MGWSQPSAKLRVRDSAITLVEYPIIEAKVKVFAYIRSDPCDALQRGSSFCVSGTTDCHIACVTNPVKAVVPSSLGYIAFHHDPVPPLLDFSIATLYRVLIGSIGLGLVLTHIVLLNCLHEESVVPHLGLVVIESEVLRHTIICDKILERLAHLVPGHCLEMVALCKPTAMGVDLGTNMLANGLELRK